MSYLIKKEIAKNGEETLNINGVYIHSKYNPTKEAKNLADKYYKKQHTHIILGYGLGYFVRELINKCSANEKIIVVEAILEKIDDFNLNVNFIKESSRENILKQLNKLIKFDEKINVIISPNYDRIDKEMTRNLLQATKDKIMGDRVIEKTFYAYENYWHKNYIRNLKYVTKDESLTNLHNVYCNTPIVIAAGGPSLMKQLPLLKKYRKNILLISAGSTISSLMKEGIEPDYALTIDGAPFNYENFKGLQFKDATILYSVDNYYKIRENFNDKGIYFVNQNEAGIMGHLESITNEKSVAIPVGTSVANTALAISAFLGAKSICMIGQDLAYTNNLSHASNNKAQRKLEKTPQNDTSLLYIKGFYGEEVITDYVLLSMKKSFENMVQQINNTMEIYNCTEGGAFIEGMKHTTFEEFLQKNSSEKKLTLSPLNRKKLEDNKLKSVTAKDLRLYNKLKKLCEKNLKLLNENKSTVKFDSAKLSKMQKNDKQIKNIISKTSISMALYAVDIKVSKYFKSLSNDETAEEIYLRTFRQSEFYYNEVKKVAKDAILYIEEMIESLEGEYIGNID